MHLRSLFLSVSIGCGTLLAGNSALQAQPADEKLTARIQAELSELEKSVAELKQSAANDPRIADVEVYAKAVQWILRHDEFYKPDYVEQTLHALRSGRRRAAQLSAGKTDWLDQRETQIRGYYSAVDGSVQPYALSLPTRFQADSEKSWPLHLKLHGRGATLNEVNFIHRHDGQPPQDEQTWVQLDVFGRTNNAYRWSGESDVFEALADVQRQVRIDPRRITLWGFSMGGAGAWHLGLHYPSLWSSVGPGAGFVDFYKYQKQTEPRPTHQHKALRIYDSIDYVLNTFNVPVCTYGGELDKQLVASTSMAAAAGELNVPIKLLVGKGMGHKFHPDSFREFMAFHCGQAEQGRPPHPGRREIRFVTQTLKYNRCEWLTIEEMLHLYEPARVEGRVDEASRLKLTTNNIAVLQISRDIAEEIEIDGSRLPLNSAADGLLPGVYYERRGDEWEVLDHPASLAFQKNPDLNKRHNLQGPIDDAFMQPFLCVRGSGQPWSDEQNAWVEWTLARFEREFDKWLRGQVPVVDDSEVTPEMIAEKNLILFGDPGSNSVLAQVVDRLPIRWTREFFEAGGVRYDPSVHGLSLIYPNPLNPRRYVVVNSGHTFHERDFRASNAWLFPRLGDIAVQKFARQSNGDYTETTLFAGLFDANWRFSR